jgi:hypothetical protein
MEPPPPDAAVAGGDAAALSMTTEALAVAAGGAPAHVMEKVTVPAFVSVTFIEPEDESEPVHPSPGFPPVAEHVLAFFELQVKEILWPAVCVEALLDSVTLGVATFGDVAGTAT